MLVDTVWKFSSRVQLNISLVSNRAKHSKIDSISCEIVILAKSLVRNKQGGSDKTEKFSHFMVIKDVLEKMIGSIEGAHDDVILKEKLLMLENFQLSDNNQQVVKDVTI